MINIKKLITSLFAFLVALSVVSVVSAAPNNENKAANNPNVVAFYNNEETDLHAIPTDPITYLYGTNLVLKRGNSDNIEAWYTGSDGTGYHSVWNVSKKGNCSEGWNLIEDAYPSWGDYLTPGADYCVKVNAF